MAAELPNPCPAFDDKPNRFSAADSAMEINDRDYQLSLRDRQLRAFFEGALDAMLIMDDEGRYLDVNPAACDLLGLPKDLLLGRRLGEFIEGGISLVVPSPDSESPQPPPDSESPQPPQREYRLLRADGSDRTVECAATPHFLPHRHLAVLRDITPRKSLERSLQQANRDLQQLNQELEQRVEQRTAELSHANQQLQREIAERQIVQDALRCSEAKLNDVLDSTIAAISCARVYRDRTWRYEYISQGTEAVFGFTPQELMADPMLWIMQVLPEDRETVFSTCFDHIFAETPYRLEFRLKRKDGNLRWIAGTFSPRWDAREQCWLVHGFCTDITDHKTAEEALHFSQDRLSLLVTANPAVIYSCRASGTYGATSVSPNVEGMLGYPPEAFLDDPQFWLNRLHPDDQARVMADAATLLTQDHLISEYRFLHRDGAYRWVHDELQVLCREQGQPVELVGYWIDISDRKQLEERLQVQLQKEQMLNQMMQAIHQSLDLDQIFATATTAIADIAPADRVEIVQYLPERGIWLNVADYRRCADWPSALGVEIPDEGNAIAAQLKRREIVCIHDAGTIKDTVNPELSQAFPGAWLLVPICSGTSLWGSLSVVKNQPLLEWSESEVDLLVAVANQLAIAIHQSELYQQVQQLNATLETQVHEQTAELQQSLALEELLKRITDKVRDSLDEAQILQTAVNELGVGLRLEGCDTAIYDSDRTTSTIAYEYAHGIKPVKIRQFAMADSTDPDIYQRYLLRGRSCQFCFRHDSVMRPHHRGQFTILACPIVDDQGILGDLWLFKPSEQHFTSQEIRLIKTVANQCAIALRQSRLYKTAQHQVEELERINQLKDDFLNTVSHEMRSPIANIKMATELLEICLNALALLSDANSPIARYFQILKDECHREINLINDLLDLSRLDANTEPLILLSLDLAQVLPHLVEPFIDRAATQQQQLEIDLDPNLPHFSADLSYLERIIAELLNNACKYTPAGERILLSARYFPPVAPESDADLRQSASEVSPSGASGSGLSESATEGIVEGITEGILQLCVANSGVEISAQERDRIFDRFYRIPKHDPWKHGGTGLGLALVKKLTEVLGGEICVESDAHQTSFIVRFRVPHIAP